MLRYSQAAGHGMTDIAQWTKLQQEVIRNRKNGDWIRIGREEGSAYRDQCKRTLHK